MHDSAEIIRDIFKTGIADLFIWNSSFEILSIFII